MDINNNQQVNTFTKGMNTDTSDALLDNSQYRYARNLRLVTNTDSNDGELRMVEGTGTAYTGPWERILAMTAIRDYVIVIAEVPYVDPQDSTKNFTGVSIFTNRNKGVGNWTCIVDRIPKIDFIQDNETEPHFSLVTRWESDNNIKLYIADGVRSIICLNISDGHDYKKSPHNDIEDIAAYVSTNLTPPFVQIKGGGKLKTARVQYAYRLYNIGEPATHVSPLSRVSSLYKDYNTGYKPEAYSNKSAVVTIPNLGSKFNRIQIYRITYILLDQLPEVDLVYDGSANIDVFNDYGQSIESISVDEFLSYLTTPIVPKVIESKEDYMYAANIKYEQDKYDEKLKDIDFRSYSTGDFDGTPPVDSFEGARAYNNQYAPEHKSSYDLSYWIHPHGSVLGGIGNVVSWTYAIKDLYVDLDSKQYYKDTNRSQTRGYEEEQHNPNHEPDPIDYDEDWDLPREPDGSYEGGGGTTPGSIPTSTNNIIEERVSSLRRGEVYRYGIILYNTCGVRSSVKWVADIMVPSSESLSSITSSMLVSGSTIPDLPRYDSTEGKWKFSVIGITFRVNTSQIPECAGYEIVRCKRTYLDTYNICQGIIGIPERVYKEDNMQPTSTICPTGFMTPVDTTYNQHSLIKQDKNYLQFSSPEYCYTQEQIKEIVQQEGDQLTLTEIQSFFPSVDSGVNQKRLASVRVRSSNNSDILLSNKYSKILYPNRLNESVIKQESLYIDDDGFLDSRDNGTHETCINHVVATGDGDLVKHTVDIYSAAFPEVPLADSFFSGKTATFRNALTPVGEAVYQGWSVQGILAELEDNRTTDSEMYDFYTREEDDGRYREDEGVWDDERNGELLFPISTTGKCIVFKLQSQYPTTTTSNIAPIVIADLRKDAVPYNGPESYKEHSPEYYSFGLYMDSDPQSYSYITTYDGDCFPGVFVYHAAHAFDNSVFINANKMTTIYYVPVESGIDLKATYGDIYTRKRQEAKAYYIQDIAGAVDGFIQDKDAYLYNTAYHSLGTVVTYSQVDYKDIYKNNFDSRVHHSEQKINNQNIDSWTHYKSMNFIDVDSRFGEITNMRLFKDKLLYWQKNATGILSANERTMFNDVDSNQVILGTGAVLQRFDYISTQYGMKKNQYEAEIQSNYTQYWWDGIRKEILGYSTGMQLIPLTATKNLRNYVNKYDEQDKPTLVYNPKYNEILASVVEDKASGAEEKNCLVYNEKVEAFTSVYRMMPQYRTIVDNTTIITDTTSLYHMDSDTSNISLLGNTTLPMLKYVINKDILYTKVFDIVTFGGRFYGGDNGDMDNITFTFDTPLKQHSTGTGSSLITNREYDFRLDIPRNDNSAYGDRMRGKTMQCELKSSSNSYDFSLQYIVTKYRMSWS